jgi:hypothetical protein
MGIQEKNCQRSNTVKIELRALTMQNVKDSTFFLNLPVVFSGSMTDANNWARDQGFSFIPDQSIFGGYWNDEKKDISYLIT